MWILTSQSLALLIYRPRISRDRWSPARDRKEWANRPINAQSTKQNFRSLASQASSTFLTIRPDRPANPHPPQVKFKPPAWYVANKPTIFTILTNNLLIEHLHNQQQPWVPSSVRLHDLCHVPRLDLLTDKSPDETNQPTDEQTTSDVEELQKKKQSDILQFLLRVRCWEVR